MSMTYCYKFSFINFINYLLAYLFLFIYAFIRSFINLFMYGVTDIASSSISFFKITKQKLNKKTKQNKTFTTKLIYYFV